MESAAALAECTCELEWQFSMLKVLRLALEAQRGS